VAVHQEKEEVYYLETFYFIAYSIHSFLEGNYTPTEEVSFGRILLPPISQIASVIGVGFVI
jgi:hypothetical protein